VLKAEVNKIFSVERKKAHNEIDVPYYRVKKIKEIKEGGGSSAS